VTAAALRDLLDQQALRELVIRYCRAIDRRDEELLRSCYHPDAFDHHGVYAGGVDGFIEYLRRSHLRPDLPPFQHTVGNMRFDVRGDLAYGEVYVETRNVQADGSIHRGVARYIDRYERRDGEWRFADRRVVLEAARPGFDRSQFQPGSRDGDDPSTWRRPMPKTPNRGTP